MSFVFVCWQINIRNTNQLSWGSTSDHGDDGDDHGGHGDDHGDAHGDDGDDGYDHGKVY